jgi:hypothetical protein
MNNQIQNKEIMENFGRTILVAVTAMALTMGGCKKETGIPTLEEEMNFKKPVAVDLSISAFFNGPSTTAGTFTSTGFLNTSGTTAETVTLTSQTFHGQTIFTDANGSFTAVINGQWSMTSPSTALGQGNWNIINGTGDYAQLKGNGQLSFTVDFATGAVNDTWTGDMHIQ